MIDGADEAGLIPGFLGCISLFFFLFGLFHSMPHRVLFYCSFIFLLLVGQSFPERASFPNFGWVSCVLFSLFFAFLGGLHFVCIVSYEENKIKSKFVARPRKRERQRGLIMIKAAKEHLSNTRQDAV